MGKRKFKRTFIFSNVIASIAVAPLSSCTTTTKEWADAKVNIENKNIVTHEHLIQIPFSISDLCTEQNVLVKLAKPVGGLSILQETISCPDSHGIVEIKIDDSISTNIDFKYDLLFNFVNTDMEEVSKTVYNFHAYFISDEPIKKDDLTLLNNCVINNLHKFDFGFEFFNKPMGDTMSVEMTTPDNDVISLDQNVVPIVQESDRVYRAHVSVTLDMSVVQSSVFSLSFKTEFTNSLDKQQIDIFDDCTIQLVVQPTNIVPKEYYDITVDENGVVLHGIKPRIPALKTSHFDTMILPEEVDTIDENAFSDSNFWSGIHFLTIPKSVQNIGQHAFAGLINAIEIDLTNYKNQMPPWFNTSDIFDRSTFKSIAGYVWVSNAPDTREYSSYIKTWGIEGNWSAFNDEWVSKEEDFYISEDKQTLLGIRSDRLEDFYKYKVVKIPETIRKINKEAFKELETHPYVSPYSPPHEKILETRRLILNSKLVKLEPEIFRNKGFSGPILVYSRKLNTISSRCFENMHHYGWPGIYGVVEEPIQLMLINAYEISTIEQYAFDGVPFDQDFTVPLAVRDIANYAFQGNKFHSITFNGDEDTVGLYAFANVYVEPKPCTITTIDLSKYVKPINPREPSVDWKYIPGWAKQVGFTFRGSCAENGTVYINQKMRDEIGPKWDEWQDKFKQNHSIPSGWTFAIK